MKSLKTLLLALVLIIVTVITTSAQAHEEGKPRIYRFKAEKTTIHKPTGNSEEPWKIIDTNEDTHILIVLDLEDKKIDIYAETPTHLNIYDIEPVEKVDDSTTVHVIKCINQRNVRADVNWWKYDHRDPILQLEYQNYMISYFLVAID